MMHKMQRKNTDIRERGNTWHETNAADNFSSRKEKNRKFHRNNDEPEIFENEVEKAMARLNRNKAAGSHGMVKKDASSHIRIQHW